MNANPVSERPATWTMLSAAAPNSSKVTSTLASDFRVPMREIRNRNAGSWDGKESAIFVYEHRGRIRIPRDNRYPSGLDRCARAGSKIAAIPRSCRRPRVTGLGVPPIRSSRRCLQLHPARRARPIT